MTQAVRTLAVLFPGTGARPTPAIWGRGELATRTTGSAHGLDDGTLLVRPVLRGIALARDVDVPADAAGRRALWRRASVTPDEVSSTVLTHGLRPTGDSWQEAALRERADHHLETHLTLRELRVLRLNVPPRTRVHVCGNPRVVEAAADAHRTAPLICTSGSAATVVLTLLDALSAAGCTLAYHGDFDWPGIALANRTMQRYGEEQARPRGGRARTAATDGAGRCAPRQRRPAARSSDRRLGADSGCGAGRAGCLSAVVEEQLKILHGPRPGQKALRLGDVLLRRYPALPKKLRHPFLALLADRVDAGQQLGHARRVLRTVPDDRPEFPPSCSGGKAEHPGPMGDPPDTYVPRVLGEGG